MKVKKTKNKGRGIFADRDYKKGNLIESCPTIFIPASETKHITKTVMTSYVFAFDTRSNACLVTLGYGSLYNHSADPNARYVTPEDIGLNMKFYARKDIKAGEEITVSYNDEDCLWFDNKE